MARPERTVTPAEADHLADIRALAAERADQISRQPPLPGRLRRIAWAVGFVGELHPATADAVQDARPHYTWREIGVALGEDPADPSMPGRVQRRWAKRWATTEETR